MEPISSHPLYRRYDIDTVMSSLWTFYKSRFLVLFIASFMISLAINYLSMTLDFKELQSITDPAELMEKLSSFIWPILTVSLVNLFFSMILNHYVIYNPLDESNSILVSCYKALKYFIPYLIIMVLLAFFGSLAMALGLLVLIIGIFFALLYVMTIYLFILPVMLVEGTNIGNVISRTFRFVHKGFWSNIGWVAVFIIILMVLSILSSAIVLIPFTGKFLNLLSNPQEAANVVDYMTNPVFIILSSLVNALYFPLMPIFATILYFNSRAKEDDTKISSQGSDNYEPPKVTVEDLYAKPRQDDDQHKDG